MTLTIRPYVPLSQDLKPIYSAQYKLKNRVYQFTTDFKQLCNCVDLFILKRRTDFTLHRVKCSTSITPKWTNFTINNRKEKKEKIPQWERQECVSAARSQWKPGAGLPAVFVLHSGNKTSDLWKKATNFFLECSVKHLDRKEKTASPTST